MFPTDISSDSSIKGMVAIVAGGAGGIGRETALTLARRDAQVVILDAMDATGTKEYLKQNGYTCESWTVDISKKTQVSGVVKEIIAKYTRIDIMVYGIGICPRTRILDIQEDEWDNTMNVNLKGAFLLTQAVLPNMMENKSGSLIYIGSIAGRAYGLIGGPHYAASKAAIQVFGRYIARVGAPYGIRSNCVLPGPTETSKIAGLPEGTLDLSKFPLGRLGKPADTAQAILYLASPASSWITGVWLDVNGGSLMA